MCIRFCQCERYAEVSSVLQICVKLTENTQIITQKDWQSINKKAITVPEVGALLMACIELKSCHMKSNTMKSESFLFPETRYVKCMR